MAQEKDNTNEENMEEQMNSQNPFANLDEKTQQQIQELQFMEQTFQQLMMQKQAFSREISETETILKEVEGADEEISKIVGNKVIIKTTKEKILEEMKDKKQILDSRMKNIDEQEKEFSEKVEELRSEIIKKIQK